MKTFFISLTKMTLNAGETLEPVDRTYQALWLATGAMNISGRHVPAREGALLADTPAVAAEPCTFVVFDISADKPEQTAQLTAPFSWDGDAVLRLDQVSFLPSACAYRHVHPGPGIRYLTEGALEIQSDHDCTMMNPGDAWFEDAESPVRATAAQMPTAFVRAMILPSEFMGKPTLRLLNDEDHDKPRLQTNTRFFDAVINLSAA